MHSQQPGALFASKRALKHFNENSTRNWLEMANRYTSRPVEVLLVHPANL